jgi:hypothetical protein
MRLDHAIKQILIDVHRHFHAILDMAFGSKAQVDFKIPRPTTLSGFGVAGRIALTGIEEVGKMPTLLEDAAS